MSAIHVDNLSQLNEQQPTFVAVGSFDGVHKGHQLLLQSMVQAARQQGAQTAVLTFFPHPRRVIQNLTDRYYLMPLQRRVEILQEQGIDIIITQPFTEEIRHTRASDFIDQLQTHLNMRQLWGGDFALGYKREGDVPFLRRLGKEKDYTVELVNGMVEWGDRLVSSSRARAGLADGDVVDVAGCLGRPYRLKGTVVEGDKRGRTINFPTANLDVWDEQLLPANGVYGTYALLNGKRYVAATNVGLRPTVNGRHVTVEAHLLDFNDDIYGQELTLDFMTRVRAEKKFSGLDELKAQIAADVQLIRQQLVT